MKRYCEFCAGRGGRKRARKAVSTDNWKLLFIPERIVWLLEQLLFYRNSRVCLSSFPLKSCLFLIIYIFCSVFADYNFLKCLQYKSVMI